MDTTLDKFIFLRPRPKDVAGCSNSGDNIAAYLGLTETLQLSSLYGHDLAQLEDLSIDANIVVSTMVYL